MKIGTYNLQFLFDEGQRLFSGKEYFFSKEFVEKRFKYFAQEFDNLNPDILFLQELGDESALAKVLSQTKNNYSYFIAQPDKYGVGNAVIYKSDLDVKCSSIPTNTSLPVFGVNDKDVLGSRIWSRRDYVKTETPYKDKTLVAIGLHLKSNFLMYENGESFPPEDINQLDAADGIIRSELFHFSQAKKIRELVDREFYKDENAYVVVVGDFNALYNNKCLEIIRGRLRKNNDVLVPILDKLPVSKRYSVVGRDENRLIDHVFVSKSLDEKIDTIQIHNENIVDQSTDKNYPYIIESDHAPITFNLK